jgi:hypothetical protein
VRLRIETLVTVAWMAERLQMGSVDNVNTLLYQWRTVMKYYIFLLAVWLCPAVCSAQTLTNVLSIHLLDKALSKTLQEGIITPAKAKLIPPPIFWDEDFVVFNTTNHTFAISAEAAKRLARKLMDNPTTLGSGEVVYDFWWPDTPFVLAALGQPIYVGQFSCVISSASYRSPTIYSQASFISTNCSSNVIFTIEMPLPSTNQPALSGGRIGTDVRNDPRILAAVKKLGI